MNAHFKRLVAMRVFATVHSLTLHYKSFPLLYMREPDYKGKYTIQEEVKQFKSKLPTVYRHDAPQSLRRCNAKASVLQCKGHIFHLPLHCKAKSYNSSSLLSIPTRKSLAQWYNKRYECTAATKVVCQSALGYYPPGSARPLGESCQSGADPVRAPAGAGLAGPPTKCDPPADQTPLSFSGQTLPS